MASGPNNQFVRKFVEWGVATVKNVSFIVGVFSMLFMDLVFGASYYGKALATLPHKEQFYLGWGLSIATTAIQIMAWSMLDRTSIKAIMTSWTSRIAVGVVVVLTIVDTIADLGALTQFVYKDTPALTIIPPHPSQGFWVIAIVVLTITMFNEPMLAHFVENKHTPGVGVSA